MKVNRLGAFFPSSLFRHNCGKTWKKFRKWKMGRENGSFERRGNSL